MTNQGSIPFGYLLHLFIYGHQGPVVCLMVCFHFIQELKDQNTGSGRGLYNWRINGVENKG